ncbi:hypothetical protein A8H39_01255 [Paraburkholderia fungorum]|nr:hypothetical protein A8H39_01255 [Paraburkholderia fungorum]
MPQVKGLLACLAVIFVLAGVIGLPMLLAAKLMTHPTAGDVMVVALPLSGLLLGGLGLGLWRLQR